MVLLSVVRVCYQAACREPRAFALPGTNTRILQRTAAQLLLMLVHHWEGWGLVVGENGDRLPEAWVASAIDDWTRRGRLDSSVRRRHLDLERHRQSR